MVAEQYFNSFADSFNHSKAVNKSILLGNGFSMSHPECSDLFSYKKLADSMKQNCADRIKDFFALFGTSNFEAVMNRIDKLPSFYPLCLDCIKLITETAVSDKHTIKEGFISALKLHHPDKQTTLTGMSLSNGAKFLKPFSQIYTTNYDMLLYWVIMKGLQNKFYDGFCGRGYEGYIPWQPNIFGQNTNYLHGALHIFRTETHEAVKLKANYFKGTTLMEVIENVIDNYKILPNVILEGSHEQKHSAILKSPYLSSCYDRLLAQEGDLYTFGSSFEFDDHILSAIENSRIENVYIGYYGDWQSSENQNLYKKVVGKLPWFYNSNSLFFYPSNTVKLWE